MPDYLQHISSETLIGILAGVITSVSMLPQVIKTIKTKESKDISVFMIILLISGLGLWVYYGFLRKDYPIIFTNSFSCLVDITLLCLHLKYRKKDTPDKSRN